MQHIEHAHHVRRVMNRRYSTPITIEQLGAEVALSPQYLIRLFRRTFRQTPHQYLIRVRIARAKELLSQSDMSITDVCAEVGFESLGSFSTLFRKIAGVSPKVYRQRSQAIRKSVYVPLCACRLHGVTEPSEEGEPSLETPFRRANEGTAR